MNKKIATMVMCGLALCASTFAESKVLLESSSKDVFKASPHITEDATEKCVVFSKLIGRLTAVKSLEIEPAKKYKVTFTARKANADADVRFWFGINSLNEAGEVFVATAYPNTDTTLAAPAKRGDTVIKLKDGSKIQWGTLAFNTTTTTAKGAYRMKIRTKPVNKGDHWEIELDKPILKEFPENTPVCAQTIYGGDSSVSRAATTEWKTYSVVFAGEGAKVSNFRVGAKSIAFSLFYTPAVTKSPLQIKDMIIEEL